MNSKNLSKRVWRDPRYFVAFGFGSGLMPFVPGTWGTLAAVPVYLLLSHFGTVVYALCTLCILLLGGYVSEIVSKDLGVHDYKGIVIDEVAGYLLSLFLMPVSWSSMLTAFVVFRVFDIWKPFPIGYIDKHVKGGLGIMLDDVIAAVLTWFVLFIIFYGVL